MPNPLTHSFVTAEHAQPRQWAFFLHGMFGSGANWRTLARRYVTARPDVGAVLVDLRMHGGSQSFAPPHTLAATAADVRALESSVPGPVRAVVGHSFGGKVALAYVAASRGDLDEAWVLDSTPSARPDARGAESTLGVLSVLESAGGPWESREEFVGQLTGGGMKKEMAQWLAMNLRAEGGRFALRLDTRALRDLLTDYFAHDLWNVVETPPGDVTLHLVIGGRSATYDDADRARAARAADASSGRVRVHTLERAGHWVHVDDPEGLLGLLTAR